MAAVETEDFEQAAALHAEWTVGGSFPPGATPSQEARLGAGRHIVPGVCFRHRLHGYRAVVVVCTPVGQTPAVNRMAGGVGGLPRKLQPVYHCLIDKRDQPGSKLAFVVEEDIDTSIADYPVQNKFLQPLLVPCDVLKGYLLSPELERVLSQQRNGKPWSLWS